MRVHTPSKTTKYETRVRVDATLAMADAQRRPFDAAIAVTVALYVPIPKSWTKKKKDGALAGTVLPISRPDADNFAKGALDACNGIVWKDDSQIVDLIIQKRYSADPRLTMTVQEMATPLFASAGAA